MKKIVLLLVAAAFAASPAAAETKHKKAKMTAEEAQMAKRDAEIAKQNQLNYRAMKDALPLLLPSWLPVYFTMQQDDKTKKK
jgi:Ni/Co efflux regulator RcnB